MYGHATIDDDLDTITQRNNCEFCGGEGSFIFGFCERRDCISNE